MKQVPADYSVVMCRTAREMGMDLLEGTGLSLADIESRPFLPLEDHIRIMDRYTALQTSTDWGFRLGQQLTMANHGALGFGAISAPTIRDGLAFMCRYIKTRASYLDCRIELPHGAIWLVFEHDAEMQPYLRRSCETLAAIFQAFIESAGGTAAPSVWRFPYPEPDNRTDYEHWIHGGCTFGVRALRLELPASVGMVPSAFRNDTAYQSAVAQCEAMLVRASVDPLVDKVRGILGSCIEQRAKEEFPVTAIPSAEEVAKLVGISRRTLIRQLQQAGTSFQAVKDALLTSQIETLVSRPELTLAEIAARLGYADAANFTRACKRLFNVTPKKLRSN